MKRDSHLLGADVPILHFFSPMSNWHLLFPITITVAPAIPGFLDFTAAMFWTTTPIFLQLRWLEQGILDSPSKTSERHRGRLCYSFYRRNWDLLLNFYPENLLGGRGMPSIDKATPYFLPPPLPDGINFCFSNLKADINGVSGKSVTVIAACMAVNSEVKCMFCMHTILHSVHGISSQGRKNSILNLW